VLCADVIFENFASLSLSFQKRARVCTRFTTLFDKKISPRPNERKRLKRDDALLSLSLFFGEATQTDNSLSQSVRVFQRRVFFVTTGAVFSFELLKSGSKNRISTHNATKSERGNDNITNERHKKKPPPVLDPPRVGVFASLLLPRRSSIEKSRKRRR